MPNNPSLPSAPPSAAAPPPAEDAWVTARALARRDCTAVAVAQAGLARAAEREPTLQAFAHLDPDTVLARARALDAGPLGGPLHGLPLGVKDLIDTADAPTAYGSRLYAGHRPRADAAAVALCLEAGALFFGKTVTTTFAYFDPGPTCNPHHPGHTPGGSSSGSAAAVGAGVLPLALGTQTAGSIIRPAAYCGVVGYKPTLGRVPRAGVKGLSDALDTVGGFGRSVRDAALLGAVLTGDRRMLDVAAAPDGCDAPGPRWRVGMCRTPEWPLADADVHAAWAEAERRLGAGSAGLVLRDAALPAAMPGLVALQKELMAFEMARALSHERVAHADALSPRLRELLDEGIAIDGARHAAMLVETARARRLADAWFDDEGLDAVLAPSATGEAPAGLHATGDPVFCRGWTLLGLPCVHLPFTRGRQGLPVGLQLVGRAGDDHRLLAAARRVFEVLTDRGSG